MPSDPVEVLSDWLPNQLAAPTPAALNAVVDCLYHREQTVRYFAAQSVRYWPEDEVRRRVIEAYLSRGPSDVIVNHVIQPHLDLLARAAPYLQSNDRVLLGGAILAATRLENKQPTPAMERALLDAAEHIIRTADEQTISSYAVALGAVKDDRAGTVLWNLISRRIATEQSLIAITWRKNPADLPRLSALLEGPVRGEEASRYVASLPYAMRNSFGEAALPYLEIALKNSRYEWIRVNCARELMIAGRASGFAFAEQAIKENRPYKDELIPLLKK